MRDPGNNMGIRTEQIYKVIISAFFWCFLLFFLFLSLFSRTALSSPTEVTYFLPDSILKNILAIIAIILVIVALRFSGLIGKAEVFFESNDEAYRKAHVTFLVILGTIGMLWVLATQHNPADDATRLQHGVYDLLLGNYWHFGEKGYFGRYPHQLGLVVFCWAFSVLFGTGNYVTFGIFNVFCLVLFYYEMSRVGERAGFGRLPRLALLVMGILFTPLIMYCSSIYGTLGGMAFSMAAVRHEMDFFSEKNVRSAAESVGCVFLALLLKKNSLIFMIGMIIYAFVRILRTKHWVAVVLVVSYGCAYLLSARLPIAIASEISGEDLNQGISSWCWVAMGMQDGYRAPGWYNDFMYDTYDESGYNTEISGEIAREAVAERLDYFAHHKREAVEFYTKKSASIWVNPTFQVFWILQSTSSGIRESDFINWFIGFDGERAWSAYLKVFMVVVYFLSLVGMPGLCRSEAPEAYVLPMIFVGGALFHIFIWEAEGQYTIPYFPLLFPCVIAGMQRIRDISAAKCFPGGSMVRLNFGMPVLVIFLSVIMCIGFVAFYSDGRIGYLTADADRYNEYIEYYAFPEKVLPNRDFKLCALSYPTMGMTIMELDGAGAVRLSAEPTVWNSSYSQGRTYIYVTGADRYQYLTGYNDRTPASDSILMEGILYDSSDQEWIVKRDADEDDRLFILYKGKALTYNDKGDITLESLTMDDDQSWIVKQ